MKINPPYKISYTDLLGIFDKLSIVVDKKTQQADGFFVIAKDNSFDYYATIFKDNLTAIDFTHRKTFREINLIGEWFTTSGFLTKAELTSALKKCVTASKRIGKLDKVISKECCLDFKCSNIEIFSTYYAIERVCIDRDGKDKFYLSLNGFFRNKSESLTITNDNPKHDFKKIVNPSIDWRFSKGTNFTKKDILDIIAHCTRQPQTIIQEQELNIKPNFLY